MNYHLPPKAPPPPPDRYVATAPAPKNEMVEAIKAHTAALLELAQAIREHAILSTTVEADEDDEITRSTYLDGSPVQ